MTDSLTLTSWTDRAASLTLPSRQIIGGQHVESRTGATADVVSPRDGTVIAAVPDSDAGDVDAAVAAARHAFDDGWSTMAPARRKRILHRLADAIEAHRQELALLISLEMGKPITFAYDIELRTTINCYRWYAEWADKLTGEVPEVGGDALALITREPVGVVGRPSSPGWSTPQHVLRARDEQISLSRRRRSTPGALRRRCPGDARSSAARWRAAAGRPHSASKR